MYRYTLTYQSHIVNIIINVNSVGRFVVVVGPDSGVCTIGNESTNFNREFIARQCYILYYIIPLLL